MVHLKRAVAIFSEVGGDERARLPEIWKLVELVKGLLTDWSHDQARARVKLARVLVMLICAALAAVGVGGGRALGAAPRRAARRRARGRSATPCSRCSAACWPPARAGDW